MLVNDPGFHAGDDTLFDGKRMTYYGRWTYKFEEAARQGASAALIIHDDAGAGYGWGVVQNSWSGPQFDLPRTVDTEPRLPAQGWLTADAGKRLFTAAGLDRSEEHPSELQSLMRISYAVFCLKKKKQQVLPIDKKETNNKS